MNLSTAIAQARIAEQAWEAELKNQFGKDANNARYYPRGKGEPGTLLAALHGFYAEASAEMHKAFEARRAA